MACTQSKHADTKYKVFSGFHVLTVSRATTLFLTLTYYTHLMLNNLVNSNKFLSTIEYLR